MKKDIIEFEQISQSKIERSGLAFEDLRGRAVITFNELMNTKQCNDALENTLKREMA